MEDERVELAEMRTLLALERDRLAADRTLMAWMRTTLGFMGFGFGFFHFFRLMSSLEKFSAQDPRRIGLILIALGIIFLTVATFEYMRTLKALCRIDKTHFCIRSPLIASAILLILGLFAFGSILFRILLWPTI